MDKAHDDRFRWKDKAYNLAVCGKYNGMNQVPISINHKKKTLHVIFGKKKRNGDGLRWIMQLLMVICTIVCGSRCSPTVPNSESIYYYQFELCSNTFKVVLTVAQKTVPMFGHFV